MTAISNSLRQIQIDLANSNSPQEIKIYHRNLNSPRQIPTRCGKLKFIAANSNSPHQIQIHHCKFKFITANSNSPQQIQNSLRQNQIERGNADGETRTCNSWITNSVLYSSEAIAGKEFSLSSWCIASLYIYHFSTVIDFSSEKYRGSTGHRNSWYQWRNLQRGCRW